MDHAALAEALGIPAVIGAGDPSAPVVLLPDGSPLPSPLDECAAYLLTLPEGTDLRVAATKWVCRHRIEVLAGMTPAAQANWTAALLTLADILLDGGTLTADQQADRAFGRAAARWIAATRAASDVIEATPGLSPFAEAAPWPPLPDPSAVRPVPKYVS